MQRIYSLKEIYLGINTRKIRNFIAFLLFNQPIQGIHESKRRKPKKIYKVRLCRSYANNNSLGIAPSRMAVKFKTVKYNKIFQNDGGKTNNVEWIGQSRSDKPKLTNGYSLHVLYKKEWRPLHVKPIFKRDRSYTADNLADIQVFCYLDTKKGKTKSWSLREMRRFRIKGSRQENVTQQTEEAPATHNHSTIIKIETDSGYDPKVSRSILSRIKEKVLK